MDFIEKFEVHQVERIRRAILAYRDKHDVGDVTLANEILKYLPPEATYDATLKNVWRLRKGKHMRGAEFLNACVEFLRVERATPPEEELGLAMKRFVGSLSGCVDLWEDVAGDYVLRVLGERNPSFATVIGETTGILRATPTRKMMPLQSQDSFTVLSISPGEGMDYGIARERFFLRVAKAPTNEEAELSEMNTLDRNGVCLPVGRQDVLIMIRDFVFSHMYVLRRETFGFWGTMIIPPAYEFFAAEVVPGMQQSQYDVALHRVPRE